MSKKQMNYQHFVLYGLCLLYLILIFARFFHLSADFPTDVTSCRAMYSDEGWYAGNATAYFLTGEWYVPDEMNSFVSLPVLQVFHAVIFSVFGPTIEAARLTILLFFLGILLLTFFITRHFCDNFAALFSLFFLIINYFSFAYSRFAIAEFPMTFFAMLSIFLIIKAKGSCKFSCIILSAISFMAAVLTKTSAVFALPVLAYLLWRRYKAGDDVRFMVPVFTGVTGFIFILYLLFLVFPYYDDYMFFYQLNIGIEVDYSMGFILNNARRVLRRMRHADRFFIPILFLTTIYLAVRNKSFRRHPLLHVCLLWLLFYLAQLFLYSRNVSRYYIPVYPALSILTGLAVWALFKNTRWKRERMLFTLVLLITLGINLFHIADYMKRPHYTFSAMADDIAQHIESAPPSEQYLLGYCSATVSLYNQIMYMNDLFAPTSLEEKIKKYQPHFYLSEGADFDWIREDYPEALPLLKEHYHIEKIGEYDVYQNIPTGRPMSFYRLNPR